MAQQKGSTMLHFGDDRVQKGRGWYPSLLQTTVVHRPYLLSDPAYLPGIDVSDAQGVVDWAEVADGCCRFAYARATEGVGVTDGCFSVNAQGATAAGILFGGYHVFHPDDDPQDQAAQFLSVARDRAQPGSNGYLPPVLEVDALPERAGSLVAAVGIWLDVVAQVLGRQPVIYANAGFWQTYLADTFRNRCRFWLAEYARSPQPVSGISDWTFWQYSQTGAYSGINVPVDMNWFAGNAEALARLRFC
jgi:lysozyme